MKHKYHIASFIISLLCCVNSFAQMEFVENKGQWDSKVRYRSDFGTGSFFLESNGFTVLLHHPDDIRAFSAITHTQNILLQNRSLISGKGLRSHAYKVNFLGSQNQNSIIPEKTLSTYNNYYIGNDKSKWASNCKIYQTVTYKNVYPNIDVRYYTESNTLKYDLIVRPGGNPDAIMMKYHGVDDIQVQSKELIVRTSVGSAKELYPYTYQVAEGFKKDIECKYIVDDDVVRFKVKNYNSNETLVIDPTLIFSSFTGSRAENWGYTATPGADGSLFAGGIAFSAGFPITVGPVYTSGGAGEFNLPSYDIAIMKFSSNGSSILYATYIGGTESEQPHSMIADASGNLLIAGRSSSANYPVTYSNPAKLGNGGKYDIIVSKLNPNGVLINSLKIGGAQDDGVNIRNKRAANPPGGLATDVTRRNYGDDARSEIITDATGNVYVVSCTQSLSTNSTERFPLTNAIQTLSGGGRQDGVILKFNAALNDVLFSTFFGGTGDDACFVAAINPITGNLYVAGGTSSTSLPGDRTGVISPNYQGGDVDGFVTYLLPNGSAIIKTTYQGTSGSDLVYGVQFDKRGFPYIMGTTTGNWSVINAAFSNANSKQFISKLQPDLSAYIYSTVFGNGSSLPNISPTAFLVDRCENVYVSGWGGSVNTGSGYSTSGTSGLTNINPIPGIPAPDGSDFYFFVMERNAQSQLFGSHFGKSSFGNNFFNDHVDGGTSRFDANGIIYQAVCADGQGPQFPTTRGAWATRSGLNDGFNQAVIKIEMNFAGIGASIRASIDGVIDTVGCVPITVLFTDTLAKGKMYIWDYNDPSSPKRDTTFAPNNSTTHTFNNVGVYNVMVISIDPAACNFSDTAYVTVKVGDNVVTPNFRYSKVGNCNSLEFEFENITSAVDASKFKPTSFLWDFGDGTPLIRSGLTPNIRHVFPGTGSYNVRLLVDDTAFCNAPIFKDSLLRLSANVRARFSTPAIGCVPYTAIFRNQSVGGTDFIWEFGDTQTSTDGSPTVTHLYPLAGTYNVRLIAIDENTCNKRDTSAYFTITVFNKPVARFDWGVQPPQVNTRTFFTNLSSPDAIRFLWDFGDGGASTDKNPIHQYNETNSFDVKLIAYNSAGCTDTFPLTVSAIINPLLDVPNAFTPGKFGVNGIIKVIGFGIKKMNWKIYNRWGQVVFQTENRNQGWDGTFKGVLQPMDVYTYTLEAELTDGKKLRRTGDINLLR